MCAQWHTNNVEITCIRNATIAVDRRRRRRQQQQPHRWLWHRIAIAPKKKRRNEILNLFVAVRCSCFHFVFMFFLPFSWILIRAPIANLKRYCTANARQRGSRSETEEVKWARYKIVVCDSASALFPTNMVDARARSAQEFSFAHLFSFSQPVLSFVFRYRCSLVLRRSVHKMQINNCIMMAQPLIYCAMNGTYTRARSGTNTDICQNLHGKRGAVEPKPARWQ